MKKATTYAFYMDSQPFYEIKIISTNYNIVQHEFEIFLKKNLAKLPTNCFDQLFSSTTSVGIILQPSEHDMLL